MPLSNRDASRLREELDTIKKVDHEIFKETQLLRFIQKIADSEFEQLLKEAQQELDLISTNHVDSDEKGESSDPDGLELLRIKSPPPPINDADIGLELQEEEGIFDLSPR